MTNKVGNTSVRHKETKQLSELKNRAEKRLTNNRQLFRKLTSYFIKSNSFSGSSINFKVFGNETFSYNDAKTYVAKHPENKQFTKVLGDVLNDLVEKEKHLDSLLTKSIVKKDTEGLEVALKKGGNIFSLENQPHLPELLDLIKDFSPKLKNKIQFDIFIYAAKEVRQEIFIKLKEIGFKLLPTHNLERCFNEFRKHSSEGNTDGLNWMMEMGFEPNYIPSSLSIYSTYGNRQYSLVEVLYMFDILSLPGKTPNEKRLESLRFLVESDKLLDANLLLLAQSAIRHHDFELAHLCFSKIRKKESLSIKTPILETIYNVKNIPDTQSDFFLTLLASVMEVPSITSIMHTESQKNLVKARPLNVSEVVKTTINQTMMFILNWGELSDEMISDQLDFLLKNGANLSYQDHIGNTPLLLAAQNNLHNITKLNCFKEESLISIWHQSNYCGYSILTYAVLKGNLDLVKTCLEKKINPNQKFAMTEEFTYPLNNEEKASKHQNTILGVAILNYQALSINPSLSDKEIKTKESLFQIIQVLLEAGANLDEQEPLESISGEETTYTPLRDMVNDKELLKLVKKIDAIKEKNQKEASEFLARINRLMGRTGS